ncbi:hypothetical protein SERLADRAFT_448738 [Serpula lacrymans var. lacrymans S7.9]|nr:uncharacterized protein SERLADRAFT_448738 [Serpula lacrymans var. lacrymans S7.9]EGO25814.1 hypothetical protein SERLADRAFT_448738 [Serpula lacrymans var. lacrymans S7.9]
MNPRKASLKHARSMPFHNSSSYQGRPVVQEEVPRLVYRGKRPLQKSDIVYVEGVMNGPQPDDFIDFPDFPADYYTRNIIDRFPVPPTSTPDATPMPSSGRDSPVTRDVELGYAVDEDEGVDQNQYAGKQRSMQKPSSVSCFSRPTASAYPSLAQRGTDARGYVRTPAPRGPRDSPSASSRQRARTQSHNVRSTVSQSEQPTAYPKSKAPRPQLRPSPSVSVLKHSASVNIPQASPAKSFPRSTSVTVPATPATRTRKVNDMPGHPHVYGSITGRSIDACTNGRDIRYHDATGVYAQGMTAEYGEDWEKAQIKEARRRRATSTRSRRSDKASARH